MEGQVNFQPGQVISSEYLFLASGWKFACSDELAGLVASLPLSET